MEGQARSHAASALGELQIRSFDELLSQESTILERIAERPNGGNLFMAHPFRLLHDVGVVLSDECRREVLRRHPELTGLSDAPYVALQKSDARQHMRFRIRGLFRQDSP